MLEVIREERRLNAVAAVLRRGAAEVDVAERAPFARVPAAVIPGTDDEEVLVVAVELLEAFVDRHGTVEVFLVPPAGHIERGNRDLRERGNERLALPELIVVGMRDKIVPRRDLPLEHTRIDIRPTAERD